MFDNRRLNIIGEGDVVLKKAVELAFLTADHERTLAWAQTRDCGLIFYWSQRAVEHVIPLPTALSPSAAADVAVEWLKSEFASTVERDVDCAKRDYLSDVTYVDGWQVYYHETELGLGNVARTVELPSGAYAICAIKPAYLLLGK